MSSEPGKPIPLKGATRIMMMILGAALLSLPILAYLDARLGLLGSPDKSMDSFGLVMAIFAVLGGVLLLSGIIGMWLMWKDVSPLSGTSAPDLDRITITEPTPAATPTNGPAGTDPATAQNAPEAGLAPQAGGAEPPYPGQQRQVDLLEADSAFIDAAMSYYDENLSTGTPFSRVVQSVWRSKYGRPNYYFELRLGPDEIRWIRVPHRGKVGGGAGTARE